MCALSEAAEPLRLPLQQRRRWSATCRASIWVSPSLVHLVHFPFSLSVWNIDVTLTGTCDGRVYGGVLSWKKEKGTLRADLLNVDVSLRRTVGCWFCLQGLEKKEQGKKTPHQPPKFFGLILFTGPFSVGSVAIALKTLLHTLVKGAFASLRRAIRTRERRWSHPSRWPHSFSLSSFFARPFGDARTYGRRDSCLLIIITLQRKRSATSAWASLAVFIPCVSSSVVK